MLGLRSEQRRVFGEKVLDLANLAAAALIFSQFMDEQAVSWRIMAMGVVVWFGAVSLGLWLMGAWQWSTASES